MSHKLASILAWFSSILLLVLWCVEMSARHVFVVNFMRPLDNLEPRTLLSAAAVLMVIFFSSLVRLTCIKQENTADVSDAARTK
jgi:hypothetical protein